MNGAHTSRIENAFRPYLGEDRILLSEQASSDDQAWAEAVGNDPLRLAARVQTTLQLSSKENIAELS
jgi:hypothetical protein